MSMLLPKELALLDGSVSGRIAVNGSPLKASRVGLMYFQRELDDIDPNDMQRNLLASRELNDDGSFVFNSLTEGSYYIVVLAGSDVIPSDMEPDKLALKNIPGVIALDMNNRTADLGQISLSF